MNFYTKILNEKKNKYVNILYKESKSKKKKKNCMGGGGGGGD